MSLRRHVYSTHRAFEPMTDDRLAPGVDGPSCKTCQDTGEVRWLDNPPDPQTENGAPCPDCPEGLPPRAKQVVEDVAEYLAVAQAAHEPKEKEEDLSSFSGSSGVAPERKD